MNAPIAPLPTLLEGGWIVESIAGEYIFLTKVGLTGGIQIKADEAGFVVDIYQEDANVSGSEPIASTYATYAELEADEDTDIFKCRACGERYLHNTMASDHDIAICKWCAGEMGGDDD